MVGNSRTTLTDGGLVLSKTWFIFTKVVSLNAVLLCFKYAIQYIYCHHVKFRIVRVTYILELIPETAVCSASSKKVEFCWTFFLPTFAAVCMFCKLHIHSMFFSEVSGLWNEQWTLDHFTILTIFAIFFFFRGVEVGGFVTLSSTG